MTRTVAPRAASHRCIVLTCDGCRVAGQLAVADMDADGMMDVVFPVAANNETELHVWCAARSNPARRRVASMHHVTTEPRLLRRADASCAGCRYNHPSQCRYRYAVLSSSEEEVRRGKAECDARPGTVGVALCQARRGVLLSTCLASS